MTDTSPGGPDQPAESGRADESRCAHCGALLAPGISWCAQCYAPVSPAWSPDGDDTDGDDTDGDDTDGDDTDGDDTDGDDRLDRGPLVGGSLDAQAEAETDQMLARLGSDQATVGQSARSALWSLTSAMSNTGVKVAVIVAGTVLLSVLGIALLSLLGRLV